MSLETVNRSGGWRYFLDYSRAYDRFLKTMTAENQKDPSET